MTIPGVDGLLSEVPSGWRKAGYAAILAGAIVAGYFIFVSSRIADAMTLAQRNEKRIDRVDRDIATIKDGQNDIQNRLAASDQKTEDLKDSVDTMSRKLDTLLMREGRRASFP